jgi:type I restriction enzyme M protein
MLDSDTKRRINTCRDILVGKVPDPKSQVEQITIALIYKFMDDMDLQAEEMGGVRSFFTGEYERYAWAKLVSPGVSGQEMLNTYSEALTKMVENDQLPALFRDIFRNAYLPYRDPETLRSFLREINGFSYDHSERLGDAFEYLLSVLGSQGDAGQFRTPRHIIDFMVEIIDPKKEEIILDPACGTAGFLISSYKHILKANSTEAEAANGNGAEVDAAEAALESPLRYSGDMLTPEDRQRLANNIKGYDISPDMVRLSLVNLYLHGFADPKCEEYDTLTSEDKWGQTADVILANPPFMSPKGGIKPHNRFQVQSKRSEVLFVDYIAEHLNPTGRAAIIVPEGIIFQGQSAYCDLRKMLVNKFLAAVISLPAGVFNPYSGVKTSILILDRAVAKASDSIVFFKIENDGFGLGAQRRAVKGGQLPKVKAELDAWLAAMRGGGETALESSLGFAVKKARIAEDGQYNLSGERYREGEIRESVFPLMRLDQVCELIGGSTPSKQNEEFWSNGTVKWVTCRNMGDDGRVNGFELITDDAVRQTSTRIAPAGSTILVTRVSVGKAVWADQDYAINQDLTAIVSKDPLTLYPEYLFVLASHLADIVERNAEGIGVRGVTRRFVSSMEIPFPPLELQREIVTEINGYQKVIDGARAVLGNYRPYIPIDPAWPVEALGDLCNFASGGTPSKANDDYWTGQIPWVSAKDLKVDKIHDASLHVSDAAVAESATHIAPAGSLLVLVRGMGLANGVPICEVMVPCAFNQDLKALVPNANLVQSRYLAFALRQQGQYFEKVLETAAHGTLKLNTDALKQTKIPLPPLEIQQTIVAEIEAEQALVAANRDLISRFERKIETAIARVWGEAEAA